MTFSYSVARTAILPLPPEMKGIPIRLPFSSPFLFLPPPPSLSRPQSSFSLCPSFPLLSVPFILLHSADLCYSLQGILSFSLEKKRAFQAQTAATKSISMKYYYTHASLFPPLFETWPIVSNRVTVFSFVVHPPVSSSFCSRSILLLSPSPLFLPQKWQKGGWSTGFFDFRPNETFSFGTSTGYKVYFPRPTRNSRLKADFLTPNIRTTRQTNFDSPIGMTRLIDRLHGHQRDSICRFDRSRLPIAFILSSTIESESVGRFFQRSENLMSRERGIYIRVISQGDFER